MRDLLHCQSLPPPNRVFFFECLFRTIDFGSLPKHLLRGVLELATSVPFDLARSGSPVAATTGHGLVVELLHRGVHCDALLLSAAASSSSCGTGVASLVVTIPILLVDLGRGSHPLASLRLLTKHVEHGGLEGLFVLD